MFNLNLSGVIDLREEKSEFSGFYIYFLLRGGEVVYVGQSVNPIKRMVKHNLSKKFDSIRYFKVVGNCYVNDLEAHYIVAFNPEYNKTLPQNTMYTCISEVADDSLSCDIEFLRDNECEWTSYKFNNGNSSTQKYYMSSVNARKIIKSRKDINDMALHTGQTIYETITSALAAYRASIAVKLLEVKK